MAGSEPETPRARRLMDTQRRPRCAARLVLDAPESNISGSALLGALADSVVVFS